MVFILSFLVMALIMAGMAIGAMAGRGPLKGSCGGLSAVGIDGRCEICGDDPSLCEEQDQSTTAGAGGGKATAAVSGTSPAPGRTEFYDAAP